MSSLVTSYDDWMRSFALSTEALATFRICFALHGLLLHVPAFEWIGTVPDAFFHPKTFSLGYLFSDPLPPAVLLALSLSLIGVYCCLLFGYRTRAASLLAAALMTVGLTFSYSFGKTDHNFVFYVLTLLLLAFSPWGRAYSIDAKRGGAAPGPLSWGNAWPVALLALLIGFGYLSAGLPKFGSWIDFDVQTQGSKGWLLRGAAHGFAPGLLGSAALTIQSLLFWEIADWLAVLFELGIFVAAIWGPRPFRWFAVLAVLFHLSNYLLLNIDFTGYVIVYALFLPWERLSARCRRSRLRAPVSGLTSSNRGLVAMSGLIGSAYLLLSRSGAFLPGSAGLIPLLSTQTSLLPSWASPLTNALLAVLLLAASLLPAPTALSSSPAGTS